MESIKILIAEDMPEDAEMAQKELKNEGIDFTAKVVDNEQDFKKEILLFKPSLVISDYAMPAFNGLEALKITKKLSENIPVIIFTGSMNEETAVACMKAGATDYVIKEQVRRLPFAVREAIEHNKTKIEKEEFEKQLIESERKFRDLFYNHLAVKLIIHPKSLQIVEANQAAADFYGWSTQQLEKMKISDINILDEHDLKKKTDVVLRNKKKHFEFRHRLADGSVKTVDVFSSRVIIQGEEFLHSIIHDITDRDRAENIRRFLFEVSQLSLSKLNLRDYLKAIHEKLGSIMIADNFYVALYDQKANTYTFPYDADQYEDFTTDSPVSLTDTLTDYVRKTGKAQLITEEKERELNQKEVIKLVGEPSPVWIGAPLIDSSKQEVIGVIALQDYANRNAYTMQDLDTLQIIAGNIGTYIERIKNLEQLRLFEKRFKSFLNSTSDLVQLEDENYRMIFMNNAQLNLIGLKNIEDAIGKTVFELLPQEVAVNCQKSDKLARETGQSVKAEEIWGENIYETLKFPVDLGEGKTGVGAFIRDITEKKKMLQDLVASKEKAEENDRLKSAFLANMSHEIRTPMNGILGFLDLIKDPELSREEMDNYIDVVRKSGDRLLNTINDIIEISKIESGEISVHEEQVDINERMRFYYDFFQPEAERKNLQFKLNNQLPGEKILIKTDQSKLDSILTNFIKNALKFTKKGHVEIGCKIEAGDLMFTVEDTGSGIPEEKMESIFDRFVQADTSHTRPYEGSGLGLSISKAYAEILGGEIAIDSESGKGSTFIFSIPFKPAADVKNEQEEKSGPIKKSKSRDKLVLVVEDDFSSYELIKIILQKNNFEICHAIHGKEAIDMLKDKPQISLVLMDMKMPVMDGYEATTKIREFNKDIPVIALTAYALEGDKEKALEAGCNDYLSKPMKQSVLIESINKYL